MFRLYKQTTNCWILGFCDGTKRLLWNKKVRNEKNVGEYVEGANLSSINSRQCFCTRSGEGFGVIGTTDIGVDDDTATT